MLAAGEQGRHRRHVQGPCVCLFLTLAAPRFSIFSSTEKLIPLSFSSHTHANIGPRHPPTLRHRALGGGPLSGQASHAGLHAHRHGALTVCRALSNADLEVGGLGYETSTADLRVSVHTCFVCHPRQRCINKPTTHYRVQNPRPLPLHPTSLTNLASAAAAAPTAPNTLRRTPLFAIPVLPLLLLLPRDHHDHEFGRGGGGGIGRAAPGVRSRLLDGRPQLAVRRS